MLIWFCGALASLLFFAYAASYLDAVQLACSMSCWQALRLPNKGFVVHWTKRYRGYEEKFFGPVDFWIEILTHFPLLVLLLGIAAPAIFGFYGLEQCGFFPTINMDFSTYLAVDLPTQYTYDCIEDFCSCEAELCGSLCLFLCNRRFLILPINILLLVAGRSINILHFVTQLLVDLECNCIALPAWRRRLLKKKQSEVIEDDDHKLGMGDLLTCSAVVASSST